MRILAIVFGLLLSIIVNAQRKYWTTSAELIFSFAHVDSSSKNYNNIPRFSAFFNLQELHHRDLNNTIGFFSGFSIRNVGFIFEHDDVKTKVRSYALGVPLAIKLGSFDRDYYIYGGAELEWMFNFKRKDFHNGSKTITTAWFSSETNPLIPSVFVGVQFPKGVNLKFKYYMMDFLNTSYTDNNGNKPYQNYHTQMVYFSVGYHFKNRKARYGNKGIFTHLH